MVNRAALVLKYKEPAVTWINNIEPDDHDFSPTRELINRDRTVYLINEEDAGDEYALDAWVIRNFQNLFESELEDWYTNPQLWPHPLTLDLFHEWFDIECHTVLIDTVGIPIFDDESASI